VQEISCLPFLGSDPLYRLRWQIELFFKSIKSMLNADQITSANENIALSIAYGSILASMVASSAIIEEAVAVAHIELKSITAQRLMMVFSLVAHNFAQCLVSNEIKNKFFRDTLKTLLHSRTVHCLVKFLKTCPWKKTQTILYLIIKC